jgi:DNA polymerase-1
MIKKTLFVIDAYNLIYRMFYAIPEMTTRTWEYVNTVFGVAKFLKGLAAENPDAALLVTTDVGKSFRADIFTEYKGTRERMPDNLRSQIDAVFTLFAAAGIETLSREWYEADDLIGSIAHQHENNEYQIVIVSSDKDLCQFVRDGHVHIFDAMKHKFLKEKDVIEKFGVPYNQVCDYLAIVGDSSDNIPGISWFGPKKAVDLLTKYGTLEWVYDHIEELTPKMQEVLIDQKENAFLSQKLASIVTDLDVTRLPEAPFAPGIQNPEYIAILQKYEFRSLIPATFLAPQKEQIQVQSEIIDTLADLERLQLLICGNIWVVTDPLIISTNPYGKIVLGYMNKIYSVDSNQVDTSEFITSIIESDIQIVGYELKADLRRLYAIQKPLQNEVEGQGRLF